MAKIGFIGLGHMGRPMVSNLLNAGHDVNVFDVVDEVIQAVVQKGAIAGNSAGDCARDVDVVFTMLQSGEQVTGVYTEENGIFDSADKSTLLIDSSSIDVTSSRLLHKLAREKGFAMLDTPVSGGVAGAEAATLTIMVGGSAEDFEKAKPFLSVLGKKIVHAGGDGNGQVAKICNNMILGVTMIATSEAFALGEKLGLDPKAFFDISSNASGQNWSMTSYCPVPGIMENVPSNNGYQPGFTSKMMLKDLRLSQEAAQSAEVSTPLGAEATMIYSLFVNEGNAETDFSGIINFIKMSGK